MTPAQPSAETVEVIQSDRDAGWPLRPHCYRNDPRTRHNWNEGVYDKLDLLQTLARHRLAHSSPPASDVVDAASFLIDRLNELEWMDDGYVAVQRDYFGHVEPAISRLAAAIRRLKEPTEKGDGA